MLTWTPPSNMDFSPTEESLLYKANLQFWTHGINPQIHDNENGLTEAILVRAKMRVAAGLSDDIEGEFWVLFWREVDTICCPGEDLDKIYGKG